MLIVIDITSCVIALLSNRTSSSEDSLLHHPQIVSLEQVFVPRGHISSFISKAETEVIQSDSQLNQTFASDLKEKVFCESYFTHILKIHICGLPNFFLLPHMIYTSFWSPVGKSSSLPPKMPRSGDIQMKISASSPIIWLRQIFWIFSLPRIFPYRCLYAFQHDNARDILSHWPPKYHSERILCTT